MTYLHHDAIELHKKNHGKLGVHGKIPVLNTKDLSLAYSPGVAEPCLEIAKDESKAYDYTMKGNLVGVVTNGTAVLGLGHIGPTAAIPVMEGKSLLFQSFAGVDAFPICLNTLDTDKIVEHVKMLEPIFGGINLEDIAAPQCFEVEERLKKECNIPVFHDDQHGTAIVTAAGLLNALKLVKKELNQIKVVINGAGAAGIAITKILYTMGVKQILLCDTKGIIYEGRTIGMNKVKEEVARFTNPDRVQGDLAVALQGTDVFVGVSAPGVINETMVQSMNQDPIIFALANPDPEIMPDIAMQAGVKVIATGRSDFPNQINNVLAFPGIFRGALDVHATDINESMKLAAVYALASLVSEQELNEDCIVPRVFDPRVAPTVAAAVAKAAMESGVARIQMDPEIVKKRTFSMATIHDED